MAKIAKKETQQELIRLYNKKEELDNREIQVNKTTRDKLQDLSQRTSEEEKELNRLNRVIRKNDLDKISSRTRTPEEQEELNEINRLQEEEDSKEAQEEDKRNYTEEEIEALNYLRRQQDAYDETHKLRYTDDDETQRQLNSKFEEESIEEKSREERWAEESVLPYLKNSKTNFWCLLYSGMPSYEFFKISKNNLMHSNIKRVGREIKIVKTDQLSLKDTYLNLYLFQKWDQYLDKVSPEEKDAILKEENKHSERNFKVKLINEILESKVLFNDIIRGLFVDSRKISILREDEEAESRGIATFENNEEKYVKGKLLHDLRRKGSCISYVTLPKPLRIKVHVSLLEDFNPNPSLTVEEVRLTQYLTDRWDSVLELAQKKHNWYNNKSDARELKKYGVANWKRFNYNKWKTYFDKRQELVIRKQDLLDSNEDQSSEVFKTLKKDIAEFNTKYQSTYNDIFEAAKIVFDVDVNDLLANTNEGRTLLKLAKNGFQIGGNTKRKRHTKKRRHTKRIKYALR